MTGCPFAVFDGQQDDAAVLDECLGRVTLSGSPPESSRLDEQVEKLRQGTTETKPATDNIMGNHSLKASETYTVQQPLGLLIPPALSQAAAT